jgi:DNA polymerase-1
LLLQVHDELVLECPKSELVETAKIVSNEMQNAYKLSVPLKTDARSGPNWYEMADVQLFD